MANITPKDPVTLGLTTQRELDAAVAKAAKAAGTPAYVDTTLDSDRAALIDQLRAEREQHARDAEAALADAGGRVRQRRGRSGHPRSVQERAHALIRSGPSEAHKRPPWRPLKPMSAN